MKKNLITLAVFFTIFLAFFSCRTTDSISESDKTIPVEEMFPSYGTIQWIQVANGIRTFRFSNPKFGIKYQLVEINLSAPELEITLMNPKRLEKARWLKTKSVESFANETSSVVAINTTPFLAKHKKNPFSSAFPVGIQIIDGKTIIEPNEKYAAIAFFKKSEGGYDAKIFESQAQIPTQDKVPDIATGGFWTILKEGKAIEFKKIRNIRAAAALKDDGKTLFLLAGYDFTYNECAEFFKKLNAENAMQFDGGNSTNLVINGKSVLSYGIKRRIPAAIGFSIKNDR